MKTPAPRPSRARRNLLAAAAVLVLAGVIAWLVVQANGRERRRAALDRVTGDREALSPADIAVPVSRRGPDPSEWLARVANVQNAWEMADVSDAQRYAKLLEAARTGKLGEDARVAFERFENCVRPWLEEQKDPDAAWNAYWIELAARLQEADGTKPWKECAQSVAQLLATGLEPSMKLARAADGLGSIDPRRVAGRLEETGASFPLLPAAQEARLADAVQVTALWDVHREHYRDALDDVRAGLATARVHQPAGWLVSWMLWNLHLRRALDTLQMILPQIPRGLDVTDIERELTGMDPGGELATALRGERAFGNRVFEAMRDGWTPVDDEPFASSSLFARMQRWLVADADQAAYLESMDRAIERASVPAFLRQPQPEERPGGFWAPTTAVVLPSTTASMQAADVLQARLALARLALTAYRAGAEEALQFLGKSVDPFDGRALRWAWADESLVVFWSVGPDKKDDSAASGSDDIVWPLRLK